MTKNTKMLIGGGILAIALYYLWSKSKSKKPTTTTTPTPSTTSTTTKVTPPTPDEPKPISELAMKKQLLLDVLREQIKLSLVMTKTMELAFGQEKIDAPTQKKIDDAVVIELTKTMIDVDKKINTIPTEKFQEALSYITINELKRGVELMKLISTPQGQSPIIKKEIGDFMNKLDKLSMLLPK